MDVETIRAAMSQAWQTCLNDSEREGVKIAVCEIAVRLFPDYKPYKAFINSITGSTPLCAS